MVLLSNNKNANLSKTMIVYALVWPFLLLDVLVYILSLAWIFKKKNKSCSNKLQSIAVGAATPTHGCPRRSPKSVDALFKSNITMHQAMMQAVKQFGGLSSKTNQHVAMVTRKFVELRKIKETDKFPTKIYDDSQVEEITYQQLGDLIRNFGFGLQSLTGGAQNNTIVIYEETCKQWSISMHGALSQSMVVATCYATLGDDAVVSAVNETQASMLLLNWKHVEKFLKLAPNQMPNLHTIIASTHEMPIMAGGTTTSSVLGNNSGGGSNNNNNNTNKIRVILWDDVIDLGQKQQKNSSIQAVPPQVHDTAVIMYTSGSTGKPKGVVMTHEQLMSGVQGMEQNVYLRPGREVCISYLPLAHVLALQIENAILNSGGKICYSDARSLAKTLTMFRPTVFAGVPKVYEILRDALVKKIESSLYVNILFNVLFAWKSFLLSHGLDSPVTNIFFKQISKKIFGSVLQYAVSGGGSLNAALHNFCRVVFCCPIIQGYALTETCVGGAFQDTCDLRDGVVGPPVPCVEMMLQSEPDIKDSAGMPYLHTDTVGAKGEVVLGRGEICMRGPCISNGYYKMPEKTKEVYDEEGWFHSGDIGQFTSDGVLQIIDRKKNIVKLKGGEYVAVENMENAYSQSPLVASACVVANGDLDRALVIVHANNSALEMWAVDHGISYSSVHDLAVNKDIKQAVIASMKACGKEAGLTSLENGISDCVLVTDVAWEAGHGFTASGKIDRAAIFKMHGDQLNAMLQRNGAPPLS